MLNRTVNVWAWKVGVFFYRKSDKVYYILTAARCPLVFRDAPMLYGELNPCV